MVIPRAVGHLLVGVGILLAARWALAYLATPQLFRPDAPQVLLVIALLAAFLVPRLRRLA